MSKSIIIIDPLKSKSNKKKKGIELKVVLVPIMMFNSLITTDPLKSKKQ